MDYLLAYWLLTSKSSRRELDVPDKWERRAKKKLAEKKRMKKSGRSLFTILRQIGRRAKDVSR